MASWLILCILAILGFSPVFPMDNLNVAFQWKQVDFDFPSAEAKQEALRSKEFIPENNLPLGLEVYGERVFVTLPRWKTGVPASLAYINITDPMDSPLLKPYPNWEAHKLPKPGVSREPPEIVSPFRMRADKCRRLWVVDTGVAGLLDDFKAYVVTTILVYDLHNDSLLRKFKIPTEQIKGDSFFANIAVEDHDCENSYAYLADLGAPGLVIYSWKEKKSWRVTHHYFHIDPLAGDFNVNGIQFQWTDGIFGLALSAPDNEGHSTLYFHPMCSTNEFSVSTKFLKDESVAKMSFHEYKVLGSRGQKAQSSVSFLDQETGVLFYALINLNAIACWKTTNPSYTMQSQGRVFMSNETMVFPNDIKVDANGNLWVLSDRLPKFMYDSLDPNDVNFRILRAPVKDAIKGTACDKNLIVSPGKMKPGLTNKSGDGSSGADVTSTISLVTLVLFSFLLAFE